MRQLLVAAALCAAGYANAQIIEFNGAFLPGTGSVGFIYNEDGYTVASAPTPNAGGTGDLGNAWRNTGLGTIQSLNPTPIASGSTFTVSRNGGAFQFGSLDAYSNSIDACANNGPGDLLTFTGSLGGSTVFAFSSRASCSGLTPISSSFASIAIDRLAVFVEGMEVVTVDNIALTSATAAVPEPSTYAMLLLGAGAIALHRRRYANAGSRKP